MSIPNRKKNALQGDLRQAKQQLALAPARWEVAPGGMDKPAIGSSKWFVDAGIQEPKVQDAACIVVAPVGQHEGREPYFYCLAESESSFGFKHNGKPFLVLLPCLQARFLAYFAPKNVRLLRAWMKDFASHMDHTLDETTRAEAIKHMTDWQGPAYVRIREMTAGSKSMADLRYAVANSLPLAEEEYDEEEQCNYSGMHFYNTTFLNDALARLARPLPAGLVLFEGRDKWSSVERILTGNLFRTAPFSTSWHPNVGIKFHMDKGVPTWQSASSSRYKVLFVYKVMSPGILAIDMEKTIERKDHCALFGGECELVIQPFVKFHLTDESVMRFDYITNVCKAAPELIHVYTRVIFAHMYLGHSCPCGGTTHDARRLTKPA
jgi:hypothetical protein